LQIVAFVFSKHSITERMMWISAPLWSLAVAFIVLSFVPDSTVRGSSVFVALQIVRLLIYGITALLDIILSVVATSILNRIKGNLAHAVQQKLSVDPDSFAKRMTYLIYAKIAFVVTTISLAVFDPKADNTGSPLGFVFYLIFLHLGIVFLHFLRRLSGATIDYNHSNPNHKTSTPKHRQSISKTADMNEIKTSQSIFYNKSVDEATSGTLGVKKSGTREFSEQSVATRV
jgi:hypothetical protein